MVDPNSRRRQEDKGTQTEEINASQSNAEGPTPSASNPESPDDEVSRDTPMDNSDDEEFTESTSAPNSQEIPKKNSNKKKKAFIVGGIVGATAVGVAGAVVAAPVVIPALTVSGAFSTSSILSVVGTSMISAVPAALQTIVLVLARNMKFDKATQTE